MNTKAKVAMLMVAGLVSCATGARADDANKSVTKKPSELGHMEGMRDMHLFQVEPSIINEDYYTKGKAERHQFVGQTLPAGAPIPDTQGPMPLNIAPARTTTTSVQTTSGASVAPAAVAPQAKVTN